MPFAPVLLFAAFAALFSEQEFGAFGFVTAPLTKTRAAARVPQLSVIASGTGSAIEVQQPTAVTNKEASRPAAKLIETCRNYGQVGSLLSEQQRSEIESLAGRREDFIQLASTSRILVSRLTHLLPDALSPFSDDCPARKALTGQHELVYSASPSASSGKLGPFTGGVTQSFLDDSRFINRVELFGGLAKVELNAERKVVDDTRIKVFFKRTDFFLFGNEVKSGEVKGAGVWDYKFSGIVEVNGERLLLRVMDTPSLFVIIQREEELS